MNKKDYIAASESQPQSETFHNKIDKDIVALMITITEKVNALFADELITKKELKFLAGHLASLKTLFMAYQKSAKFSRLYYRCNQFSSL